MSDFIEDVPEQKPVFCSECQQEVKVEDARVLDGQVLCPRDLAKRGFFARMRARKLPGSQRWSGKTFQSMFTSIAALMLVVGIALVWKEEQLASGVWMIVFSILVGFFGRLAKDLIDLLLDILDELRSQRR